MLKPNLYVLQRDFEIIMEAFQGLEQLASQSIEGHATDVGSLMIPLNLQMETIHERLKALSESHSTGSQKSDGKQFRLLQFHGEGLSTETPEEPNET